MAIIVNPQNVTGYPSQTLFFDLRSSGSIAPSWTAITGATQDTARTLTYSSGAYMEGSGLFALFGSSGTWSYVLSARNFPSSTGTLKFKFQSMTTPAHYAEITITSAGAISITTIAPDAVVWYANGNSYAEVPPSNGTTYTVDLDYLTAASGQTLTAEINQYTGIKFTLGTQRFEWVCGFGAGLGLFIPPFSYYAKITTPVVTTPALLVAPSLVAGDWRPSSATSWTLDSDGGGQLSLPSSTSYTNNVGIGSTAPTGTYTIRVAQPTIGGAALDDATATIRIPAFTVLSDVTVTMQPSQTLRFRTTYDDAPTVIVSRSATGGTWTGLDYTASATVGNYTLTFTAAGQTREVVVTVAATIAPAYDYFYPGETVVFACTLSGTQTWPSTLGGNNLTGSGTSRTWVVPNKIGEMFVLSVTNGTSTVTKNVTVLEKFPYACQIPLAGTHSKLSVIESLNDGTLVGRVKRAGGVSTATFELNFEHRETTELTAALAFLDRHSPQRRFIFEDTARTLRFAVRHTGEVRHQIRTLVDCSYSFSVTEN